MLQITNPMQAHISGGHAQLIRYAQPAEQALGFLGYYDNLVNTEYAWPNLPSGAIVDPTYTKVWIQNALLQYYQKSAGQGADAVKMSNYSNRVHCGINLVTNKIAARNAAFYDRDVKVGDVVKFRGINNVGTPITLWTTVQALLTDTVATTVGSATADSNNKSTQSASTSIVFVSGPINNVTATANGTGYDGTPTGDITETYTVIVTAGSVNENFTKATLRVISGSGRDDQAAVTPSAKGSPTAIGTRGLYITLTDTDTPSGSASARHEGVTPGDLIVGQRWLVTVSQAFTAPVPTAAGTYTGAGDTTYIVTVSLGGKYTDAIKPQVTVSTIDGSDISGPTTVTASAAAVAIGTLGVTMAFSQAALAKGDRYYVAVTGSADGPINIIVTNQSFDPTITGGTELDITLYIPETVLQITQDIENSPPYMNWVPGDTTITVNSGITAYDATYTNDGVQLPLPVYSNPLPAYGGVYVEVRYWLNDLSSVVGIIDNVGNLDAMISGALTPDNPLKWGVYYALQNANGQNVLYTSVANPAVPASWQPVLNLIEGRTDVMNVVPLTNNDAVLNLYATEIKALSAQAQGWRRLWLNLTDIPVIPIVSNDSTVPGYTTPTTSDGAVALATVLVDSHVSGSQYTVLHCTSNNANFITNTVLPGDIVRLMYTSDGFGNETYTEAVVAIVNSQNELHLQTSLDAPINVAAKFEIWRNLTPTQEAAVLAANASSWGDRRISAVWPDSISYQGTSMPGYFACAAMAGLVSGVYPNQGITRAPLIGFDDVSRTTYKFSRANLDAMEQGGVCIITQDVSAPVGTVGAVYCRHCVTTGVYSDINQREEVVTRNTDNILYQFQDVFIPFYGITNVTAVMQGRLTTEANNLLEVLKTSINDQDVGGQIVDGSVISIQPSVLYPDQFTATIALTLAPPFDLMIVQLSVGGTLLTANTSATNGVA